MDCISIKVQLYSICTTTLNDECQCAYVYTANVNSYFYLISAAHGLYIPLRHCGQVYL